ncbi:MAG: GWxTD domain-containing protein [bacterium]
MFIRRVLFSLLFISTLISAQVENSKQEMVYSFSPSFFIDVANYKSVEAGKTKVDVFLQIPYSNLQFIKEGEIFKSKYSISFVFYDENKENIIFDKLWNQELTANSFEETVSGKNFKYFYQVFNLVPGKYVLRSEIIDKDSKKNGVTEAVINVTTFTDKINISDLILVSGIINDRIVPNISRYVTSEDTSFTFFYDLFSDTTKQISVEYLIKDKAEKEIYSDKSVLNVKKDKNRIFKTIHNCKFSIGEYILTVKITDENNNIQKNMIKKFFSRVAGFPQSIVDLDKAVDQMMYIAGNDEMDFIEEAADYEEKLNRFKAYWKTKDPSPNNEENEVFNEYYRRVAYANEKFKHYYDGWKTDMGMVYIILGPPSNVERHPFEYDSKPYEIWEYYSINKSFLFIDESGFGEYRLANRTYGDWFRYRQ